MRLLFLAQGEMSKQLLENKSSSSKTGNSQDIAGDTRKGEDQAGKQLPGKTQAGRENGWNN